MDKADAAVQRLQAELSKSDVVVISLQVDIEYGQSIEHAIDHVADRHGRYDVLINNAGGQFDSQMYPGDLTMREMRNKSRNFNTTGTHILMHTFVALLTQIRRSSTALHHRSTSTLTELENLAIRLNQSLAGRQSHPPSQPIDPAIQPVCPAINLPIRLPLAYIQQDGDERADARIDANPPRGRGEGLVHFAGLSGHRTRREGGTGLATLLPLTRQLGRISYARWWKGGEMRMLEKPFNGMASSRGKSVCLGLLHIEGLDRL